MQVLRVPCSPGLITQIHVDRGSIRAVAWHGASRTAAWHGLVDKTRRMIEGRCEARHLEIQVGELLISRPAVRGYTRSAGL